MTSRIRSLRRLGAGRARVAIAFAAVWVTTGTHDVADAQSLGTFRWRLEPYCNVLSLTVTRMGDQFRLEGTDDQCGAGKAAPVTGLATFNPDGSLGFGVSIVTAPEGAPVHVSASIMLPALSGTWSDSGGAKGAFTFWPGAASGGTPRPDPSGGDVTGVTAGPGLLGGGAAGDVTLSVNPALVQSRVTPGCPTGQAIRAIAQDGSVACDVLLGGGDITGVSAGEGLTGGGFFGNVALAVTFGGSGTAPTSARSDHTHERGTSLNTSIGGGALGQLTTGVANTAVGSQAAQSLILGSFNTAVGANALNAAMDANYNVAVGKSALHDLVSGNFNVSVGLNSLRYVGSGTENVGVGAFSLYCLGGISGVGGCGQNVAATGDGNAALGRWSLSSLVNGNANTAIGPGAGDRLVDGSNNVYVGSRGTPNESNVIRIGEVGVHTAVGFAGIRGSQTTLNNAVNVVIDSSGHVGTISSSRRFKDDIHDLGDVGLKLHDLRPVQFRYTAAYGDGDRPVQYGLIAEEVEAVVPELVAYGADGQPESVKYHVLPSLLLAEVQRLERERAAQAAELATIKAELASLRAVASATTTASRPY